MRGNTVTEMSLHALLALPEHTALDWGIAQLAYSALPARTAHHRLLRARTAPLGLFHLSERHLVATALPVHSRQLQPHHRALVALRALPVPPKQQFVLLARLDCTKILRVSNLARVVMPAIIRVLLE